MGTEETSRPTSAASKATNIGEIEDEEEEVTYRSIIRLIDSRIKDD